MSEVQRNRSKIEADKREQIALAMTAACGVALSGGVIAAMVYLLMALSSLVVVRPAFARSVPAGTRARLESGIGKEWILYNSLGQHGKLVFLRGPVTGDPPKLPRGFPGDGLDDYLRISSDGRRIPAPAFLATLPAAAVNTCGCWRLCSSRNEMTCTFSPAGPALGPLQVQLSGNPDRNSFGM